jgi:hypothetical protein
MFQVDVMASQTGRHHGEEKAVLPLMWSLSWPEMY